MPVGSGRAALDLLPALTAVLEGRASALLPLAPTEPPDPALRAGEPIDDDIALVVPTSGTTGAPKGALLSAAALSASATATHARLGGPGRWLLALPAHHIAGLQVLVRSVLAGTPPIALDVAAGFDVDALVAAIAEMGSSRRYVALVAAQLAKALADPAATAALAGLDAVLVGGGPLPAPVRAAAETAGVPVVRSYGMSETAGGCVYDDVPLDGVRLRLGADGRIAIGGPTLARGYRNPPNPDPFAEAGWFRTDDVGALDDSGRLQVLGRADEAISTGGLTVLPQPVEAVLAGHPGVADVAVFGLPDDRLGQRVVAAVVPAAGRPEPTLAMLREHVAAALDPTAAPREVHLLNELPRRGIGKVDRAALVRRFGG